MAEAFAIVGSTAAILQLSQFAGKVIYTACSLYDSASGHTTINDGIEDVTLKLKDLLGDLQTPSVAGSNSQAVQDERFASLVERCQSLGDKLLEILTKSKTKKAHSLRECLKASLNGVWKNSDMDDLRRELESCVNQLGLHLVAIFRSETGQKLEEILNAYSSQRLQIASLHQALEKIEHDQKLAIDSLEYLRKVFSPSDPILQRMNRNRILKSLAFEGMGRRYQDVSMSAPGTFQWVLDDLEIPKSHPELKISFRQWLTQGNGVYHISGKPGAGKSTLMKFLVEHKDTQRYLKEWAGARTLVTPSVFFWRPGTDLQKSMKGLVRSVVHSILEVVPEMIPVVFSQYWNPNEESHGYPGPDFDIPYGKVSEAFEKLIGGMDAMKNHCFCFFIDG